LLSLLRTFSDGLVDAFRFRSSLPAQAAEGAAEKRRQATRVLFKAQPKPEQAAGEPTFVQVVIQPDGAILDEAGVVECEPDPDADPQPVAASYD
jgi:hypothetical protein